MCIERKIENWDILLGEKLIDQQPWLYLNYLILCIFHLFYIHSSYITCFYIFCTLKMKKPLIKILEKVYIKGDSI